MAAAYFAPVMAEELYWRGTVGWGGWSAGEWGGAAGDGALIFFNVFLGGAMPIPECCCHSFVKYGWFHVGTHLLINHIINKVIKICKLIKSN